MRPGTVKLGSYVKGGPIVLPLLQSFLTFNIKRSYKLVWEVMDIVGENLRLGGQRDIVLL